MHIYYFWQSILGQNNCFLQVVLISSSFICFAQSEHFIFCDIKSHLFMLFMCVVCTQKNTKKEQKREKYKRGGKKNQLSSYFSVLVFDKDLLPGQHRPNSQTWNCHALTSGAERGVQELWRKGGGGVGWGGGWAGETVNYRMQITLSEEPFKKRVCSCLSAPPLWCRFNKRLFQTALPVAFRDNWK